MYYADIKKADVANGLGVRVSVFVSGCTHHCKNCFNEEAWDFHYGKEFTQNEIDKVIELMDHSYVAGLSLLGGEPLEHVNQQGLLPLVKKVKEKSPEKSVWCYTGFEFENLNDPESMKMLKYIDVLVDGRFIEEKKSPALIFRGSANQRIIDVKKTLEKGEIIWLDGVWERAVGSGNIYE